MGVVVFGSTPSGSTESVGAANVDVLLPGLVPAFPKLVLLTFSLFACLLEIQRSLRRKCFAA